MPWHVALDGARERRLGRLQIGTTRRGIGPAYADKATRIGIRVQDLLDAKILREKIELAVAEKNVWLERVYGLEPFDARLSSSRRPDSRNGSRRTSPTPPSSSTGRCAKSVTSCSKGRRARCSISTTAPIRS